MTAGSQVAHDRSVRQDFRLAVATVNELMFAAAAAEGRRGQQQGQQGRFVPPPAAPAVVAGNRVRDLPLNGRDVFDRFEVLQAPKDAQKNVQVQQLPGQGGGVGFGIGQGRAVARDEAFMRADIMRANVVTVREYAHTLRPNWTEGSRVDFAETVYWNAGVKTDASTGIASVSFNLSDSVTSFRVLADGFTQDGALGSGVSHVESVQPFSIEPKMPLQVTSGDAIQLPIGIVNGMSRELRGVEVTAGGASGL